MNTTVSALISWADAYSGVDRPLLQVVEGKGDVGLEVYHETRFAQRMWRKILAFFGMGSCALGKVVSVAEKVLLNKSLSLPKEELAKLKRAVQLLNKKIRSYEKKSLFGLFPLFRRKIGKELSVSIAEKILLQHPVKRKKPIPLRKVGPSSAEAKIPSSHQIKTIKKINSEKTSASSKVEHRGIVNEGNTCFAAATLQALHAVQPEVTDGALKSFYDQLESGTGPVSGIRQLLKKLSGGSWVYRSSREDDPVDFFENKILHQLKGISSWQRSGVTEMDPIIIHQRIDQGVNRSAPPGTSLQEILDGKFHKKPLEIASQPPEFFALNLIGRWSLEGSLEGWQEANFNFSPYVVNHTIDLPTEGGKKEPYRLASVVMYALPHHFYTLEPIYNDSGKLIAWNKFNDAAVSRISHTNALERTLKTRGYLFFYKKA